MDDFMDVNEDKGIFIYKFFYKWDLYFENR